MNDDYCFMKRVSSAFLFIIFFTTSCSSVQKSIPQQVKDGFATQSESLPKGVQDTTLRPTNPEVMYHVFSAEVMGSEGDFSGAATEYLKAALVSDDPEIAERAARVAVSAGEWQMVVLASDRWAMLAPSNLDARELAAGSRLREGDYVGAQFQLARILEMTATDRTYGWSVVTALLAPAHDQGRANKVLVNLLNDFDNGSNVGALFARSQLAARTGDLEKAAEFGEKAIALEPGNSKLLAWSGRVAINNQDLPLALKRYRQAWEASPKDPQIAMAYAELLKRNNELAVAQKVLSTLPDTPDMRFARIVFSLDGGDRQTAEMLYAGFSDASYQDVSNMAFQAAQSAELLGLGVEAVNWYKQVTGEKSTRAVLRQAFLLAGFGDVEQARNLLTRLRLQTDSGIRSQSYQAEAQILQDNESIEAAMAVLNEALTVLPADISVRYNRALLAARIKNVGLAESDLRQIISIEPENVAAINALGYTLADLTERYEEAEQLILRAYELQPDDASVIDSMGWVSYRLGRLDEAEMYLREAWEVSANAEIAAHLGEVLWSSGKKEEAGLVWRSGLQVDAENEVLIDTMRRFGEQP